MLLWFPLNNFFYTGHAKGCGITEDVMEWMQSIQNSAVEDLPELKHPKSKPYQREGPTAERLTSSFYDNAYAKYSREANNPAAPSLSNLSLTQNHHSNFYAVEKGNSRGRRALKSKALTSSRTTCHLSIQTDPLLWKHIKEQV